MTHFAEEDLIALLDAPVASNEHMDACAECREKFDTFRAVMCGLKDESVWDTTPLREEPVPATIVNLRAFADQMAAEDADAELLVRELLDGPRESWMPRLHEHPEYRTAGMVRKLIESASHAIDTMPPDAVAITMLATEIADHLDPATYTSDTVPHLRGTAWRERAYALFYTGAFADAEAALHASESNLSDCVVNEYELARVGIVRALVENRYERYAHALMSARASARVFEAYYDRTRSASARLAEVLQMFGAGDFARAYEVLMRLKHQFDGSPDSDTYVRIVGNLAYCCSKLHRSAEALGHYDAAAHLLSELGIRSDAARARWSAARVLAEEGRSDDALNRLREVAAEFEHLGMSSALVEVRLEIAEILATHDQFEEVESISRAALAMYEQSQLTYTAPARVALALLKDAARHRTANPTLVREVRNYLRRLPKEPDLLFAYAFE